MMLAEEILVEILMIAAVVLSVTCLAHLLQLSVREQIYLRRLRHDRDGASSTLVTSPPPQRRTPQAARAGRATAGALRETRV